MKNPTGHFLAEWQTKDPKEKTYMILGAILLLLAIIGIFLPIVPQVPFAILAGFCFSKGSKKLHKWLRKNKYLGPPVKNWEDHKVIKPKLKAISTAAMLTAIALAHWQLPTKWAIAIDIALIISIIFVLTRKSKEKPSQTTTPR